MKGLYKNKKNNQLYIVEDVAINTTNGMEEIEMVIYHFVGSQELYVREKEEFLEKFDFINS